MSHPSAGGKIEGIVAEIDGNAPGIPPCGSGELPGYTIGRVIGEGGFCKVHLGVHHFTREKVAIKMIDKGRLVEQADRRRVGREIRVLKRLSHQSVIRVFDVVESHSRIYVVMEYCEGGSLLDYVRGKKRLSEAEACAFMHQVLRGLENCHENGVVHQAGEPAAGRGIQDEDHRLWTLCDPPAGPEVEGALRLPLVCGP